MAMKVGRLVVGCVGGLALLVAVPVWGQDDEAVDRLEDALRRPHVAVDTALVFTNLANTAVKVSMAAFTSNGRRAGAREIEVPANGVRYVLASELVAPLGGARFIGKVTARGLGQLASSAVLFGGHMTDLRTIDQTTRTPPTPLTPSQALTVMTFPLVVTF